MVVKKTNDFDNCFAWIICRKNRKCGLGYCCDNVCRNSRRNRYCATFNEGEKCQ